jgi:homoserine dehydrogenase
VTLDLILVGFGNVGRRFIRLLGELEPMLAREGVRPRVVAVATRSHGHAFNAKGLDAEALAARVEAGGALSDESKPTLAFLRQALRRCREAAQRGHLVIVETTILDVRRGQPAIEVIQTALSHRAHVVSANKGPVAIAHDRLMRAAARAKRSYLHESAVLDGVPVFNLARTLLPGVTIAGFEGVVNTTTNYMLAAMEQGGSFDGALADMQAAGIAEADPSLDVDGWDAAAKTAALANVMLGARITPSDVAREGIEQSTAARALAARSDGRRLKLVASATRGTNKRVDARVRLEVRAENDLLARLEGPQNAIVLRTDLLGEIAIVQRGSSLTHTAYGLFSDLMTIARSLPRSASPRRPARRQARRQARGR